MQSIISPEFQRRLVLSQRSPGAIIRMAQLREMEKAEKERQLRKTVRKSEAGKLVNVQIDYLLAPPPGALCCYHL
jgi:hypothetical protein